MTRRFLRAGLLVLLFPLGAGADGPPREDAAEHAGAAEPITIRWTAASEDGVHGYLVYRSERRMGPYVRINERIVRVPDDGESSHRYSFSDPDVVAGRTYHYYLDVIDRTGVKSRFSGVMEAVAEPEDASESVP